MIYELAARALILFAAGMTASQAAGWVTRNRPRNLRWHWQRMVMREMVEAIE